MNAVVLLLCVVVGVAVARSPIPQEYCPELNCPDLSCPSPQYQGMTDDGCHTCTCCPGYVCFKNCDYGFKVNNDGCPICSCRGQYE